MEEKKEELFIPKTKNKALKIIIGVLLIVGALVGAYFLYQYKFNNPKSIITNLIEQAQGSIKENFGHDLDSSKYKLNGTIKIDANLGDELSSMFNILKDIDVNFSGEIDRKESIGNIIFDTKYKKEKLINYKAYFEKNEVYLLVEDFYDKYIKFKANENDEKSLNDVMTNINFNTKDLETIVDALMGAYKTELTKLDIEQESTTILIDGKERSVLNNYVVLKNNEVNAFVKAIFNDLANDNDFIKAIANITKEEVTKETVLEAAKSIDTEGFVGTYKINFYTDKGLFKKKIVSVRQEITVSNVATSYNVDRVSDDEIIISMNSMGMTYSVKIKKTDSNLNISFNLGVLMYYVKAEINMTYEKINTITKPDLSNYKNYDELTENEKQEIEEKISKNKALNNLINELKKTVPVITEQQGLTI